MAKKKDEKQEEPTAVVDAVLEGEPSYAAVITAAHAHPRAFLHQGQHHTLAEMQQKIAAMTNADDKADALSSLEKTTVKFCKLLQKLTKKIS